MKISAQIRMAGIDLKKIVPKQKFKGWKAVDWKPNHIVLDAPDGVTSINVDTRGPDPVYRVTHPKSLGNLEPNGLEGTYSASGDQLTFKGDMDSADWPTCEKLLAQFFLALIQKVK